MKKVLIWFSLIVITTLFIYVSFPMAEETEEHPTYNGVGEEMVGRTLEETGAINSVTAIVFDFRGYDTLGESFVLLTAVTGAAVILRKNNKNSGGKGHEEKNKA